MDSLRIDNGVKRIMINDGPNFIEFNPSDVIFAERFYELLKKFEEKQIQFEQQAEKLDSQKDQLDANGLPMNLENQLAFMRDVCAFMREQIDFLFGSGTSQAVFGDVLSIEGIEQFFEGITPFIQTARAEKLKKYQRQQYGRVMK
jgi:hypothetical protein